MSRCFPFPPPGYERKAKINDDALLTKEKHKERKHKKDKKDKEKREDKEKKDKHRSKEKHKDKKERKEKDKHRSKEKNQASGHKRISEGQKGFHAGENLGSSSSKNNSLQGSEYVQELARRINVTDGVLGSQMVQRTFAADHRKTNVQETVVAGFVDHRPGENEQSQIFQQVAATDGRRSELQGTLTVNVSSQQSSEKEIVKGKNVENKTSNGERNHVDRRSLDKAFGHNNFSRNDKKKDEGVSKLAKKNKVVGKLENKHEKDDRMDVKANDRHQDKKKPKDKDQEKEKKEEKVVKEAREASKQQPILKENALKLKESAKNLLDFRIINSPDTAKLSSISSTVSEGNLGKRKELEMNGFVLENGIQPNKLLRPLASSITVFENGRKPEPNQHVMQSEHGKHGTANKHRVAIKDQKVNGLVAGRPPDIRSVKSSPAKVSLNANGEVSAKPPHADTKYLSQIFCVPKMEELPDSLDRDWLFSGSHQDSKNLNRISPGVNGTRQVWSEALQLESADITALPFVVPY